MAEKGFPAWCRERRCLMGIVLALVLGVILGMVRDALKVAVLGDLKAPSSSRWALASFGIPGPTSVFG